MIGFYAKVFVGLYYFGWVELLYCCGIVAGEWFAGNPAYWFFTLQDFVPLQLTMLVIEGAVAYVRMKRLVRRS